MATLARLWSVSIGIDKGGDRGDAGSGGRQDLADNWSKNSQIVGVLPSGVATSPASIAAMARVRTGLKILASTRGSCLSSRTYQRELATAFKNLVIKTASPMAITALPMPVVGLSR